MLFAETFLGVGSFFFEKQALCICAYRSSQKPELTFRVKSEPNIIKDCNALKFEVFHNNSGSLKRSWAHQEKQIQYSAALIITKTGWWGRDDQNNR